MDGSGRTRVTESARPGVCLVEAPECGECPAIHINLGDVQDWSLVVTTTGTGPAKETAVDKWSKDLTNMGAPDE